MHVWEAFKSTGGTRNRTPPTEFDSWEPVDNNDLPYIFSCFGAAPTIMSRPSLLIHTYRIVMYWNIRVPDRKATSLPHMMYSMFRIRSPSSLHAFFASSKVILMWNSWTLNELWTIERYLFKYALNCRNKEIFGDKRIAACRMPPFLFGWCKYPVSVKSHACQRVIKRTIATFIITLLF